jgi:hypothetical protein
LNDQVLLIETDTAGIVDNTKTFGSLSPESVFAARNCPDNGFLITGYLNNAGIGYAYMLKVDSMLNEKWTGAYGAGINDYSSEGIMLSENSFFLSTDRRINTGGGNFDYDVCTVKTDSAGIAQWDSVYHDNFQNGCQGIILSQAGHLLTFGETEIFQFSPFDYLLFATDTSGNLLWRQTFGGVGINAIFDLIEDPNGDLVGTGYGNSLSSGVDPINAVILKTDPFGNLLWQYEYGFSGIDIGYAIQHAPGGGYFIAGRATTPDDEDFYLIKTDQNGMTGIHETIASPVKELQVYPNPASEQFSLRSESGFSALRISEISGKTVFTRNVFNPPGAICSVPVTGLPGGIYLVEVADNGMVSGRTLLHIR